MRPEGTPPASLLEEIIGNLQRATDASIRLIRAALADPARELDKDLPTIVEGAPRSPGCAVPSNPVAEVQILKRDIAPEDVVWTYSVVRPLYDDGAQARRPRHAITCSRWMTRAARRF